MPDIHSSRPPTSNRMEAQPGPADKPPHRGWEHGLGERKEIYPPLSRRRFPPAKSLHFPAKTSSTCKKLNLFGSVLPPFVHDLGSTSSPWHRPIRFPPGPGTDTAAPVPPASPTLSTPFADWHALPDSHRGHEPHLILKPASPPTSCPLPQPSTSSPASPSPHGNPPLGLPHRRPARLHPLIRNPAPRTSRPSPARPSTSPPSSRTPSSAPTTAPTTSRPSSSTSASPSSRPWTSDVVVPCIFQSFDAGARCRADASAGVTVRSSLQCGAGGRCRETAVRRAARAGGRGVGAGGGGQRRVRGAGAAVCEAESGGESSGAAEAGGDRGGRGSILRGGGASTGAAAPARGGVWLARPGLVEFFV